MSIQNPIPLSQYRPVAFSSVLSAFRLLSVTLPPAARSSAGIRNCHCFCKVKFSREGSQQKKEKKKKTGAVREWRKCFSLYFFRFAVAFSDSMKKEAEVFLVWAHSFLFHRAIYCISRVITHFNQFSIVDHCKSRKHFWQLRLCMCRFLPDGFCLLPA